MSDIPLFIYLDGYFIFRYLVLTAAEFKEYIVDKGFLSKEVKLLQTVKLPNLEHWAKIGTPQKHHNNCLW